MKNHEKLPRKGKRQRGVSRGGWGGQAQVQKQAKPSGGSGKV